MVPDDGTDKRYCDRKIKNFPNLPKYDFLDRVPANVFIGKVLKLTFMKRCRAVFLTDSILLMRLRLIMVLFAPVTILAQTKKGFVIKGHITGVKDGSTITLKDIDEKVIVASAVVTKERFTLTGLVKQPTTCWVECGDEYATVQVENVPMVFESPLALMRLYAKCTGGEEQDLQNQLITLQYPFDYVTFTSYDSLTKKLYRDDTDKKRLVAALNSSQDISQNIYIQFGKDHPDSWLGMDILYRNRKSVSKDSLRLLLNAMSPELQAQPKANSIREYIAGTVAGKGKPLIDFTVKTIDGKTFTLSSLKGNYVLLSFWDAGCVPCRRENKNLADHQKKWNQTLKVVSFSLDKGREAWLKASTADHISWTNVSDGEGGCGLIKTQYNVQAIPAAFLINPDGIIVEMFTGFEEGFLEKLMQMMK